MKHGSKTRLVGGLGGGALTALMKTVRWEITGREHYDAWWGAGRPVIFVLWHGRLLPCSFYHRGEGLVTLISQHRDGDYIAGVVESWWGFRAIRGSSTRGGSAALRGIVRELKRGTAVAITPDGPQGPRQKMKPGPLLAAQLAGVPIIPVSAGGGAAWWVEGWDRFLIPRPFSRIHLFYGEPVFVPRDLDAASLDQLSLRLEDRLNTLTSIVDGDAPPG
jgi:lysophospholipid acyltransferase (LPLAT)-like uncharacterized protein